MNSINPFATQIAQQSQAAVFADSKSNLSITPSGGAFWQFLFGLVGEENTQDKEKELFTRIATSPEKVIEEAKTKLDKGQPLSLPELALMLQEQDREIPVDFKELSIEEIAAKIDELNKTLNDMIASLPTDAQSNPFAKILIDRLQHRVDNLQTSLDAIETIEDEQIVTLISFGLSPRQITEAVERIHEVEEKIGRKLTAEDLVAGVGGILQPVAEDSSEITAGLDSDTGSTEDLTEILYRIAARSDKSEARDLDLSDTQNPAFEKNADTAIEGNGYAPVSPSLPSSRNPVLAQFILNRMAGLPEHADATESLATQLNSLDVGAGGDLADAGLREYKGLDIIARLAANTLDPSGVGKKIGHVMKAAFADLIQANAGTDTNLNLSKGLFSAFFDGAIPSADQDLATILPMTHAAQAAHLVTSIPQAGQAHPATHTVSVAIAKMAKDGAPKSMRIELDPPELGRVHVTLELSKEKTAKIHVLAEKPETYMMLQRDAALLERALQDTGLNTDSASLSFELAEDGSAFNSNEDRDGSGKTDGRRADSEDDLEVIHSRVNWQIDPETGLTRYNIVV